MTVSLEEQGTDEGYKSQLSALQKEEVLQSVGEMAVEVSRIEGIYRVAMGGEVEGEIIKQQWYRID